MLADIPTPPPYHYEFQSKFSYERRREVKEQSYHMMQQLQGWCSNTKAMLMMDLIFNHQPKVVVEVGIYGGKSLIPMANAVRAIGEGIVYGIDPWLTSESVIGFDDNNADWWGMLDHDDIMRGFYQKLNQFGLQNYVKVIRATSADAPLIYDIDLIHIDGNHSEDSALFDVQKWTPLVRTGGFIILDDLDWRTTGNAVKWLDENCHRITSFQDSNVWGLWVKL